MTRDIEAGARMYTIFDRPLDMPGAIVVRAFTVQPDGSAVADRGAIAFAMTDESQETHQRAIEMARAHCRRLQKVRLERMPADDPKILEVWI
jgi:hypothetical protein